MWIESTECRRRSSGNIPRNHIVGPNREDSKSNDRLTVWAWEHQNRIIFIFMSMFNDIEWKSKMKQRKMWIQFTDSCELCSQIPIGLSWSLDQKRSGTELTLTNPTYHGITLHSIWWQISQDPVIQYFVPPVLLREENYEAKEGARSQYTSMVVMKTSSCFSAQLFLRISSVSDGAIADLCDEVPKDNGAPGKPAAPDHFESYLPLHCRRFYHCTATGKPGARILAKIRTIVKRPEIIQTMFWCGFEACRTRTALLYSWNRRRTTDATFWSRIHDASRRKGDSYKRMDSQEYEHRPSLEHESLLSWWSIQYRSSSSIAISRQHRFLGQKSEWRWQVRDRIDADRERRGYSFGETHCWSKTKIEAHSNVDFRFFFCSGKDMDQLSNTTITRW